MKEIMDTSLVEGYIFLFEVLDMVGKECQHVLLVVIGFLAQCLVGQCADAAVALQGALAYLEQHAQVLIVEKADAFREGALFPNQGLNSGHGEPSLTTPNLGQMHYAPAPRMSPIPALTMPSCRFLMTCPSPPLDHMDGCFLHLFMWPILCSS